MHPRWLNRGVAGIGVASFLSDVSHEVPTALLPSLLTTTLGAPAAALGTIEGIADGVAGAAKLAGGALADDPGRRRATAMGGYTATAVLSALIGAATAVWQVGVLRAGAWLSRGLRTPSRNALLTDVVEPEVYGRAYGFERAMDNAGAIVGPLLALGLIAVVGVREAILLSVIPGLLAALAIFIAVRSARRLERHERPRLRIRIRPVLHGRLGRLLGAVAAFELGNVAATLLILRATDLLTPDHGHDSAVRLAVVLYAVYNAAAMVISVPAGHVTDRRGATAVLVVGAFGALAAFVGFALAGSSVALLAALFALAGTGKGAVETAQGAGVALFAPPELLGSAFGALATIQSFANLAASAVAGALWTLVSPRAAFLYLAGWAAVSVVALAAVRR
ncbi:MAG: MFS transporter [Gaiellaceae bacterium]